MIFELITSLNWWAVLVATIAYFLLGSLWYGVLFAKEWMELREITEEQIKEQGGESNSALFLWSFLLEGVAVISLALFIHAIGVAGLIQGSVIGFGAGAGFVFTLTGNTGLFADTKLALHFIDNGYHVIGLTIAGAILGAW